MILMFFIKYRAKIGKICGVIFRNYASLPCVKCMAKENGREK